MKRRWIQCICLVAGGAGLVAQAREPLWEVGVARVDITPDYPVRLAGYAARKSESQGIAQRIYAKAIAIGQKPGPPALLLTVESCGVPAVLRSDLATRLAAKARITDQRFVVCSTHTHSAPCLSGYLSNLFVPPISAEETNRVQRYTRELLDALEKVALEALSDLRPAQLSWAKGSAAFAANRRTKGGPVDHQLPALFVGDAEGKLRAVLATYACHCTTLGGEFNQVCGDWAGFAQEFIEREFPGALGLISIGCGGDANPDPRPGLELAQRHGQAIAAEVTRLYHGTRVPIKGPLVCVTRQIELPFAALPTRAEWESRAARADHIGQQARLNLARLDQGQAIPERLPYLVQTWTFGTELAMVFLPGEVVVDYSLRLSRELDAARLWVHAYANDVPCYIPSERILKEGGYEGGGAMVYYDRPAPFAPGAEGLIIRTVRDLVPPAFVAAPKSQPK